ncbi:DUF6398 domain-containing protein [Methylomagnum sp.]
MTEERAAPCRRMAAAPCRKRPPPVASGRAKAWAGGIAHAVGRVNFLFDKTQAPHLRADELCAHFGLSPGAGPAKSTAIMDRLKLGLMDPQWTAPGRLAENPMAWLIQVNGLTVDARRAPREIQEEALRQGLIPYLPRAPPQDAAGRFGLL